MARTTKRRWLRSPAILFVAFITMLGLTGLVYAHWTTDLMLDADVQTGGIGAGWYEVGTDDDGNVDNDGSGSDDNTNQAFDMNGEWSSADPVSHGPGAVDRSDKDVAACNADGGGPHMNIQVWNAYPGYHCTIYANVMNEASVPVKAAGMGITVSKVSCGEPAIYYTDEEQQNLYEGPFPVEYDDQGPYADGGPKLLERDDTDQGLWEGCTEAATDVTDFLEWGPEGTFGIAGSDGGLVEITADVSQGIRCGTQMDPGQDQQQGESFATGGWLRVEQAAEQNVNYQWTLTQQFVNWNEWDASMCTIGSVVADADGNPVGIANGTSTPTPF